MTDRDTFPRSKPDAIWTVERQLGGVFDQYHALLFRNEIEKRLDQRGLARARGSADENVLPALDGPNELVAKQR